MLPPASPSLSALHPPSDRALTIRWAPLLEEQLGPRLPLSCSLVVFRTTYLDRPAVPLAALRLVSSRPSFPRAVRKLFLGRSSRRYDPGVWVGLLGYRVRPCPQRLRKR